MILVGNWILEMISASSGEAPEAREHPRLGLPRVYPFTGYRSQRASFSAPMLLPTNKLYDLNTV